MSEDLTRNFSNENANTLAQILQSVRSLDFRVGNLEQKMEKRLYDTRPIWEKVLSEVAELKESQLNLKAGLEELRAGQEDLRAGQEDLRAGQEDLRAGQEGLRAGQEELRTGQEELRAGVEELKKGQEFLRRDVHEIRTQFKDLERKFSIFNDRLVEIQADYRDIYDRVREIERRN